MFEHLSDYQFTTWGKAFMWWCVLSIPAALFVGAFIRAGNPMSEDEAAQTVLDAYDSAKNAHRVLH